MTTYAGRKLRPTKKDQAPTVLVTVGLDVEQTMPKVPGANMPSVFRSAVVCVSRRGGKRWGPVREWACSTPDEVWSAADVAGKGRRRVYVVSGNALDDLTLLGHWQHVEGGMHSLHRCGERPGLPAGQGTQLGQRRPHPLIFGDRADIIGFDRGHVSFRWVSVTNWADVSMADVAASVQYPLPDHAPEIDRWRLHAWPAVDQARCIHAYIQRAILWWLKEGCGTWKDTPGAAAWSSFMKRCQGSELHMHEDEPTLILEDRASFGGRAASWYVGPIGYPDRWHDQSGAPTPREVTRPVRSRVHRYDVRAMYPSLLRDELFPTRLLGHEREPGLRRLGLLLEGGLVIAAVRVRTEQPRYPLRSADGPMYPVGQFDTVLTTPELSDALHRGCLVRVYELAHYRPGRPFQRWASWVLNLRDIAKALGDPASELYVKTLANALGGRIGRRRIGWTDTDEVPPQQAWGQQVHDHGDERGPLLYRTIAWRTQRLDREDYRPGTLGACYAHLTAYGRMYMQRVRDQLAPREVIWQDTDGLVVTDSARHKVESLPQYHPKKFGHLRHEKTFTDAQYITPKHYWADGRWTLAGVACGYGWDEAGNAGELRTANPVRRAQEPTERATYTYMQLIDLSAIDPGVRIGADGWATPPKIWAGERPAPAEPKPEPGELPFWSDPHEHRYYAPAQLPD